MARGRTKYVGQCDLVRRRGASDEARWQAMMSCAQPVPMTVFMAHVDLSPLLDEGDSPGQLVADALRSDPTTSFYRSWWGTEPCWFMQTAGYEFIFTD